MNLFKDYFINSDFIKSIRTEQSKPLYRTSNVCLLTLLMDKVRCSVFVATNKALLFDLENPITDYF